MYIFYYNINNGILAILDGSEWRFNNKKSYVYLVHCLNILAVMIISYSELWSNDFHKQISPLYSDLIRKRFYSRYYKLFVFPKGHITSHVFTLNPNTNVIAIDHLFNPRFLQVNSQNNKQNCGSDTSTHNVKHKSATGALTMPSSNNI